MAPNILGTSVWYLFHVTFLAPRFFFLVPRVLLENLWTPSPNDSPCKTTKERRALIIFCIYTSLCHVGSLFPVQFHWHLSSQQKKRVLSARDSGIAAVWAVCCRYSIRGRFSIDPINWAVFPRSEAGSVFKSRAYVDSCLEIQHTQFQPHSADFAVSTSWKSILSNRGMLMIVTVKDTVIVQRNGSAKLAVGCGCMSKYYGVWDSY